MSIGNLRPIPHCAYEKGKAFCFRHTILHMMMHQTYCRLTGKYTKMSWYEWVLAHRSDWSKVR